MTDLVPDQATEQVTDQVTDVKQNRSEQLKEARKRKADLSKERDEKLARIEEQLSALNADRQKKNKRKRDDDDDEPDQPKSDSDEDDNDSVLPTRVTKIQKTEDPTEEEDGETWTTSIFRNGALLGLAGASYYLQHIWNKPRPVPPVQPEPPAAQKKGTEQHPVRPVPVRPMSTPSKKEDPKPTFVGTSGFLA